MLLKQLKLGPMLNFSYVLGDERTQRGAIVDPGFEPDALLAAAEALGVSVDFILVTHAHKDHVAALPEVRRRTGARVIAHETSPVPKDVAVGDGDRFQIGALEVRAVWTPGHQPDSVCYVAGGHVFTGDTLFVGECGRTDLPGSDPGAMWESLLRKLAGLPRDLVVCPGHDYGKTPTSTLAREFEENYTLKPRTKDEFVRFMAEP